MDVGLKNSRRITVYIQDGEELIVCACMCARRERGQSVGNTENVRLKWVWTRYYRINIAQVEASMRSEYWKTNPKMSVVV